MKHLWRALVLGLAVSAFMPSRSAAQGSPQPGQRRGAGLELGQNYPNPFNQDTRIPFVVGDGQNCSDLGQLHRVTLRIYNLLAQLVAVPVLQSGSGNGAGGEPVEKLLLTCSQYTAYWDGKYSQGGDDVASGIYLYKLEVDGKVLVKKMVVRK
jgi:hypothetical protein